MRRAAVLGLIGIFGAACTGGGPSPEDEAARAQEVVRDVCAGNYAQVRADFDETMTASLSEDGLAAARAQYESLFGAFESMGSPDVIQRGDLTVVNIPLHMSGREGQARVTYDADGKIAGLYLLRTGVPVPS